MHGPGTPLIALSFSPIPQSPYHHFLPHHPPPPISPLISPHIPTHPISPQPPESPHLPPTPVIPCYPPLSPVTFFPLSPPVQSHPIPSPVLPLISPNAPPFFSHIRFLSSPVPFCSLDTSQAQRGAVHTLQHQQPTYQDFQRQIGTTLADARLAQRMGGLDIVGEEP